MCYTLGFRLRFGAGDGLHAPFIISKPDHGKPAAHVTLPTLPRK